MAKIIRFVRVGNRGSFDEGQGDAGNVLEESFFTIRENVRFALQTIDLVKSFWTNNLIVPDGTGPKYRDATGPDAVLTRVTESDVLQARASITDVVIEFEAADYGFKDDFETDLPDPA